jgi:hypothetical protein
MRLWVFAIIGTFTLALAGCGASDPGKYSCSRYFNDEPLYPNDTQSNCSAFGTTFGCAESTLVQCSNDPNKQCCVVRKCTSDPSCPQE